MENDNETESRYVNVLQAGLLASAACYFYIAILAVAYAGGCYFAGVAL